MPGWAQNTGFAAFWIFVAISAAYVTFQLAVSAGVDVNLSRLMAGAVFAIVAINADRRP